MALASGTRRHRPCARPGFVVSRFDDIPAAGNPALWFAMGIREQLERGQSHSSYFTGPSPWLGRLCQQPAAAREMHRRKTLIEAKLGQNPVVPACLRVAASDHLNADFWRSGSVPGTRVDP